MQTLMRALSSALTIFLLASPLAAQTTLASNSATTTPSVFSQSTPFTPATSSLPLLAPSGSSSNTSLNGSNSDSGSGLSTGLIVGGALVGGAALGALILSTAGISTAATVASQAKGLSFGGRIVVAIPCLSLLGPSVWVTLIPAPATKHPFYIWTPLTVRGLPPPGLPPPAIPPIPPIVVPDVPPPTHTGQEILGIADIPYFCCPPPSHPGPTGCNVGIIPWAPLFGQRMQWANQSLL